MTIRRHNYEYAICPYCNYEHGDCWEWLTSEQSAVFKCGNCGEEYLAWAKYDVTYVTQQRDPPDILEAKKKALKDLRSTQPDGDK